MDRTKSEEADDWWGMRKNGTPFDRMPSERNGTNRRDAPVGLELFTTTLLSSSSEMGSTGLEISLEGVPITLGDGAMVRIVELEHAIVVAELVRNPEPIIIMLNNKTNGGRLRSVCRPQKCDCTSAGSTVSVSLSRLSCIQNSEYDIQ